ncbi:unnamed protein product [Schistosoma mattheei]|uniref:Uncharacterized protein n=1 Tax=Schistosoma mattheei TaxID=31246 RepID=A0A183PSU7_9TREM|nr:unnamed protein product [Schistosoma mattheei]
MYKNYKGDELSTLFDCMVHLFDSVEQDVLNLITHCEQLQAILIMPLLITISRITENEITLTLSSSSSLSSPSQQTTTTNLDNSNSSSGIGNTSQLQLESQDSDKIPMTYIANFLSRLTIETKRAFNRLVERLIISFKTSKPCKKVRCGVLSMVRTYIEFAECSMTVFAKSSRLVDLERAHRELVRCLMTEIDRVASRSVKTPGEVVQLENYHRLCDILRRLKMSSLDDYRQDAKNRYTLALQEYTKTCMGRPLEKLAQQRTVGENKPDPSGGKNHGEALEVDRTHIAGSTQLRHKTSPHMESSRPLGVKGKTKEHITPGNGDRHEKNEQESDGTRKEGPGQSGLENAGVRPMLH